MFFLYGWYVMMSMLVGLTTVGLNGMHIVYTIYTQGQVDTPMACVARVQYAFLSSLALVPTQLVMYAAQPASDPDCNWDRTLAEHCVVRNHAPEPKS